MFTDLLATANHSGNLRGHPTEGGSMDITTREAAALLGITQQRVQALVAAGDLPARRVAGRLILDPADIHARLARHPAGGRPLAARVAWGMLWELSGERAPWLGASERSRLRSSIRALTPDMVALRARRRATGHGYRILPAYLDRVPADGACVPGGVSAAATIGAVDLVSMGFAEVYATGPTLDRLTTQYALAPAAGADTNVRVHVVDDPVGFVLDGRTLMPDAVVGVDLAESTDPRTRSAGTRLLADLLGRFA